MPFFNKSERLEYLCFNDIWFRIVGIPLVGFIIAYILNRGLLSLPFSWILVTASVAISFSFLNWHIVRYILMRLRVRFPNFKDNLKRILLIIPISVLAIAIIDTTINTLMRFALGSNFDAVPFGIALAPIFLVNLLVVAIYEAIYFYNKLKQFIQHEEEQKRVTIQAQLDALSNQARPHFLFNSLNTLKDIIDHDSKTEAKKFIDHLSSIYRFILESNNRSMVTLEEEIQFAKAYEYVQQERFGDNLKINWNIDETMLKCHVPAMSLQLLIENAIKHNVVSNANPLHISIVQQNDSLKVSNPKKPKSTKVPSTGIGLKNINSRYQLLTESTIEIKDTIDHFSVKLPLINKNQSAT